MRLAVGAVASGLLTTNLNAITATASYGQATATVTIDDHGNTVSKLVTMTKPTSTENVTSTVPTNLDAWLDKLATAESGNRDRIKVLDVNGRYSYGCLQFQMGTFKAYSERYGLIDPATVSSWEEEIYDCGMQKQIAKRMIQENASNWRHWGYTVLKKGVGLPPAEERPVDLATAR